MSRAIREPLSGLLGAAQSISGAAADPALRRRIDQICTSADALRQAVEQILERSWVSPELRRRAMAEPGAQRNAETSPS